MSNVQYPGAGGVANTVFTQQRLYYTNKNSSGTAINETVRPGYVVCYDLWNTLPGSTLANSYGAMCTKPETNNLTQFAGVVASGQQLPTTSGGVASADAGYIQVITRAGSINAWTHSSQTLNVTGLGPVASQWYLGTVTTSVASGAANLLALAGIVGIAQSTVDTSTTSANAPVKLGQLGCG